MIFARLPTHARSGFTLVEVLVVMAIIAALLGLLLVAVGGARKRGHKTREMNNIKHVGHAWMMYGNSNNDAALPGFLEASVQAKQIMGQSRGWGVTYKLPDNTAVPLTAANLTGPWTWRLLSYLSYDHSLIHQHLDEANPDVLSLLPEGKSVAYEPAFGYNGFYVGGWWEMQKIDGIDTPRPRYYNHCAVGQTKRTLTIPGTISQIARSSEMVTFCSASRYASTGVAKRLPDSTIGNHMVMPPQMEQIEKWRPSKGDPSGAVEIVQPGTWAPIPRYTSSIAVLYADGHVDQQGFNALHDMRKWVNDASDTTFKHAECGTAE